ncbi:MAG: hypothetical protein AAB724_02725 [Patescibacteria group bacterium]
MKSGNLLKNIYIVLMVLLFALIIATPHLIHWQAIFLSDGLKEIIEAGILSFLVIVAFITRFLYEKRLKQKEEELNETLKYIGAVNLQVDQIKSIFDTHTRYPENKKDFKSLFESLAKKVLAGVNCDWVLFRIISLTDGKTLTEYGKARSQAVVFKYEIKNDALLKNGILEGHCMVSSIQENFNTKVFCVVPVDSLSENQQVLIKAIVDNLGMLYVIFESAAVKIKSSI